MIDLSHYEPLFDHLSALASPDQKQEILRLKGEILDANKKIMDLESGLARQAEAPPAPAPLEFDGQFLWEKTPTGRSGPYCQRCWDVESRRVRLQRSVDVRDGAGLKCFDCGRFYPDALSAG